LPDNFAGAGQKKIPGWLQVLAVVVNPESPGNKKPPRKPQNADWFG